MNTSRIGPGMHGTTATRSPHAGAAFTLIELLVVISIVALLIAILLPSLSAGREVARMVKCSSNQRQVALAMYSYQTDCRGDFPIYYYNGTNPSSPYFGTPLHTMNWANATEHFGYLKGAARVLICPSFTDGNKLPVESLPWRQNLVQTHYGYNFQHLGSSVRDLTLSATIRPFIPAKVDRVKKPSDTYLLMDVVRNFTTLKNEGIYVVQDAHGTQFYPASRHSGNAHTLALTYADGHGGVMKLSEPALPYNDLGIYVAGTDNKWDRE